VLGNTVKITNPEILKGLQTSHEIFNALANASEKKLERLLLVQRHFRNPLAKMPSQLIPANSMV